MRQFNELRSSHDCKLGLVELLQNLNPDFGVHTLGTPPAATIGAAGVVLYASDGFTAECEVKLSGISDCSFGGGKSVRIKYGGGGDAAVVLHTNKVVMFNNAANAGYFFVTCELYRALALQQFHAAVSVQEADGDAFWGLVDARPASLYTDFNGDDGTAGAGAGAGGAASLPATKIDAEVETEVIWEIELKDLAFEDDDVLGDGQFGKVLQGVWHGGGDGKSHKCAIKTLKEEDGETAEDKQARMALFLEEAHLMKAFEHPGYGTVSPTGISLTQ